MIRAERFFKSDFVVKELIIMEKNMITLESHRAKSIEEGASISRIKEWLSSFSISKMINSLKLSKTVNLLETSDFKISQIAYIVGFEDEDELNQIFIAKYGITPLQYRQLNYKG